MHQIGWHRAWAVFIYHAHSILRDPYRLMIVFYWSFINVVLWGYSGIWAQAQEVHSPAAQHIAISWLVCVILWQILIRTSYNVALSLYQEVSAQNLTVIFATPLTLSEWILGVILLASMLLGVMVPFLMAAAWLLYGISLFIVGWALIPIFLVLSISGMSVGFFASACIITVGTRMEDFAFMLGWALAFFSGVFYTIDLLPIWAQAIARCMPMVYTFDALRAVIATGSVPVSLLLISLALSICYFVGTLGLFFWTFERSRKKGLAQLVR